MRINNLLNKIIDEFSANSNELVTITYKEIIKIRKYDKHLYYGKLFAKPSKRLSRLLTIENEILVFVSSFREQQFKTVNLMRDIIEESNGRLEQTVAILIHCEHAGDNKIKKWGRQKGLSILSLYYDNNIPKGEKLESYLIGELFSHDPFDITGPVSDDSQFYGRRTEALDLARKLNAGQIRSYLGIRKIGKTSILNRTINEAKKHYDSKCIIVDCSKDNIWSMDSAGLMNSIASAIENIQNNRESLVTILPVSYKKSINEASDRLAAIINSSDSNFILFFDEVDYITPGSPTGSHWINDFNIFWRNLRAVYQDTCRQRHNLGIFISGVSSKWFNVESINGIENAALAFVPEEYLSPMPKGASEQMIKTLARTSGIQFEDNGEHMISEFCSDIPYWVRKASSYIHRKIIQNRPYKISRVELKKLLTEFLEQEGGVLSRVAIMHLFKVYPELQNVAINIYKNELEKAPKIYVNILEKYGVIKTNPISISGEMMHEGLKLVMDLVEEQITTDISFNKTPAVEVKSNIAYNSYDEWADELAILNRDRNLLEKKMRNIVINFIRVDSLNSGNKSSVSDRILKVIDSSRKHTFINLSPEQVLEKYTWLELIRIIEKEWSIFEKLFIDKTQFILQCNTVNERSDTHAKDADRSDIAMQRKAVRWLEDKIRKAS